MARVTRRDGEPPRIGDVVTDLEFEYGNLKEVTVQSAQDVDRTALEVLGEAMRDCPEPIETFFGVSSQHPDYECFVAALNARGVEWRKPT